MSRISILGLGAMGAALAMTLIRKGHSVTVWNRTASRSEPLASAGATVAASPAEAIANSDLTILCVVDYPAARAILAEAEPVLANRDLVNLTNGTPGEAKDLAAFLQARGAAYLDGGIMAIPPMIGDDGALILYSGSAALFEGHKAALDALAASHYLGDDPGLAPLYDLALLSGMYGLFSGFMHASALVTSGGGKAVDFLPLLLPWLQAMSGTLPDLADKVDSGRHDQNVVSNLAMQKIALDNIVRASREEGVAPDFMEPMLRLAARRVADGHGSDDISGVIETIRRQK
ncbi:NAD(P)-binding domain-containing protein [Sinorhizobium garamanticum]|uniref:NAD(P)-binding domain-containing protein n=1 Tax=Sinorhizobium garamanticum TaxID=680247 RepID=A0ABY8D5H3_9HYPH|nr:NAD(P)-binding domain-containing protein [Sinorhizobium garamanticum]WEX86121.1 NAD(P)-binding domain-containing protein [Sinorhizobium garamanticum]